MPSSGSTVNESVATRVVNEVQGINRVSATMPEAAWHDRAGVRRSAFI